MDPRSRVWEDHPTEQERAEEWYWMRHWFDEEGDRISIWSLRADEMRWECCWAMQEDADSAGYPTVYV